MVTYGLPVVYMLNINGWKINENRLSLIRRKTKKKRISLVGRVRYINLGEKFYFFNKSHKVK